MKKRLTACLLAGIIGSFLFGITSANAANTGFIWPTDSHALVRGYSQSHGGLDIKVPSGTPVYAAAGGTVIYVYSGCNNVSGAGRPCRGAGTCSPNAGYNRSSGFCNEGFGNGVVLRHGDGSYTAYAHLLAGSVTVRPGETVSQGQMIGKSGSSGFSTGPHLHFTLLRASDLAYWVAFNRGYATDPVPYLGGDIQPVTALTKEADSITETGAVLRGEVRSSTNKITECGMYIGTSPEELKLLGSDQGLSTWGTPCYYSTGKYHYSLTAGTTYYYQVYAVAGGETYTGDVKSFTTPGDMVDPDIQLNKGHIDLKKGESFQLEASVTPKDQIVTWSSTDPNVASVDSDGRVTAVGEGSATINASIRYNEILSLNMCSVNVAAQEQPKKEDVEKLPVTVLTKGAENITGTGAILRGDFTVTGGRASECGMYLGSSRDSMTRLGSDAINSTGVPFYYSTAKFGRTLTPGSTYYYQAYVVVNGETYWGDTASFTTVSTVTVTTKGADNITSTSAIVRGQVTSTDKKASECGMYFGTSKDGMTKLGSDTINANNMPFYYGTQKYGRFLTSGTTYYYQAYAIVNGVTYWGEVKSFSTAK